MSETKNIKSLLTILLFFALVNCTNKNSTKRKPASAQETAEFTATIDSGYATKDGMYLGGYVVNIDYYKGRELHGKKVRIKGVVTVAKGIENYPDEIRQGREGDTYYIESPVIEVIAD